MVDYDHHFPFGHTNADADNLTVCHAVEVEHNGDHEASVAYIAATPRTKENKSYIKRQLEDYLKGNPPEDFARGPREANFKLHAGEAGILCGEAGRRAMGFDLIA